MIDSTKYLLKYKYKISDNTLDIYEKALKDVEPQFKAYDEIREFNQLKVL